MATCSIDNAALCSIGAGKRPQLAKNGTERRIRVVTVMEWPHSFLALISNHKPKKDSSSLHLLTVYSRHALPCQCVQYLKDDSVRVNLYTQV
jgi:hypothetical protein